MGAEKKVSLPPIQHPEAVASAKFMYLMSKVSRVNDKYDVIETEATPEEMKIVTSSISMMLDMFYDDPLDVIEKAERANGGPISMQAFNDMLGDAMSKIADTKK